MKNSTMVLIIAVLSMFFIDQLDGLKIFTVAIVVVIATAANTLSRYNDSRTKKRRRKRVASGRNTNRGWL